MDNSNLIIWPIDPLPDFLTDHTLTGQTAQERIREYAARWVQLAGSLWEWNGEATFALRYVARGGRIGVYLLARSNRLASRCRLKSELSVILRAHRLRQADRRDAADGLELDADGAIQCPEAWERQVELPNIVLAQIRQLETWSLWGISNPVKEETAACFAGLRPQEWKTPRVIFPWWGPGGPFLLPMESLISQPVAASLSIYLHPTKLTDFERRWLAMMAREAQTAAEQTVQEVFVAGTARVADPSAGLAGRLYMANLRRLAAAPFLVTVHCGAAEGREDVARSLAGAVQSLVHEPAFERPREEDDRLPSGGTVVMPPLDQKGSQFQAYALQQYRELTFPSGGGPLSRLADLADAQGAATVFRLPVSVRGGVPGVRVRQLSPDFHPGAREDKTPADSIRLGEYHSGGGAYVPISDLTKHTLITGFTGSGKTVTVLQLLHQLWEDHHVPFLVLESAKQEYRGLMGVPALAEVLRVYTMGNETCAPLRLNPFELLPGTRVEAHLSKLQVCFEAAIPPVGPSSSVIAEALFKVYERWGWRLTDVYDSSNKRRFPELADFIAELKQVLVDRNYAGEVASNLEAALVGRFKPLTFGSKGRMFSTQRSSPDAATLLSVPVVLEMNDLNLDDKALVTMFVLSLLREYRDLNRSRQGGLLHITMVEEAHNILEDVKSQGGGDSSSADTRYKAVQAFCSLLTEIRALGEGLIIADQSPEKLARDAMRNTNLQIAHQLRDGQDRNAVANAMIMENEQRDYLGKLPSGQAAIFRTGLEKATFIRVDQYYPNERQLRDFPPEMRSALETGQLNPEITTSPQWRALTERFRGLGFRGKVEDTEVRLHMAAIDPQLSHRPVLDLPFADKGCQWCNRQCQFRDAAFVLTSDPDVVSLGLRWFNEIIAEAEKARQSSHPFDNNVIFGAGAALVRVVLDQDEQAPEFAHLCWCCFLHLLNQNTSRTGWDLKLSIEDRELFDRCLRAVPDKSYLDDTSAAPGAT